MAAVPLLTPLVAVIVALPTVTPVTSPEALTAAAAPLLVVQVIVRPLSGFPAESLAVALSCSVLPTATLANAGLTVTEATGTTVTVSDAVPLCPPLVAVMVVEPAARAVTSPLVPTVATVVLQLDHATLLPVSGFPPESFGVAVSCTVCPTKSPADAGLTVTEATGTTLTVNDAVPLCPSLVAVIVVEPAARAVTSPLPLTVATVALPLDHATLLPASGLPPASLGVAVNCTVCPTRTVTDAGLTATNATGTACTVMAAVPVLPPLVALPAVTPCTSPLALTLATPELLLVQVTARPASGFPAESSTSALSWTVFPAVRLAVGGLTSTVSTGTAPAQRTLTLARAFLPPGLLVAVT